MFIMLFIAITPTANETYYEIISGNIDIPDNGSGYLASGVASACFWSRKNWNGWRWDSALTYFLLISSYIARAAALFASSEAFFRRNIRNRLLASLEKALDRNVKLIMDSIAPRSVGSHVQRLCYYTYLATYAVTLAFLELYSSFMAPLLWVLLNLVWGSLQLLSPRTALAKAGAIAEENIFEFGQIIPLMLLALPIVAAFESYYGVSRNIPPNRVKC